MGGVREGPVGLLQEDEAGVPREDQAAQGRALHLEDHIDREVPAEAEAR